GRRVVQPAGPPADLRRGDGGSGARRALRRQLPAAPPRPDRALLLRHDEPDPDGSGAALLPRHGPAHAVSLSPRRPRRPAPPAATHALSLAAGASGLAEGAGAGDGAGAGSVRGGAPHLDGATAFDLPGRTTRDRGERTHRPARPGAVGLRLPPAHLDGAAQSRRAGALRPKKAGVEA